MARYIQPPQLRAMGPRRFLILVVFTGVLMFVLFIASFKQDASQPRTIVPSNRGSNRGPLDSPGHAIASKLGNETAK